MAATLQPRAVRTRENILREATRLFIVKGYHDTKLEAVQAAAGVTTGAFFHHFESKEELAFAVLDWYMAQRRQELRQLADDLPPAAPEDPLGPVLQWLDATWQRFRQRAEQQQAGCVYGNLSTALCDTHPGFRQRLAQAFEQMANDFRLRLDEAAQRCGRRLDTLALARYIVAVLEGSIILARAHQQPELLARHFQFLKDYLRQAFHGDGPCKGEL